MEQTARVKRKPEVDHHMLRIGITGGIGSGKTAACKVFEKLGIPVYYSDERAKYLMQHEHFLIDQLKKHFGEAIYENGHLNRALLAEKVFNNKPKLELLNSIVHPAVFRDTERWAEEQRLQKLPYAIKEAALLVETGMYKGLDKLIVVTAPIDMRIKRVSERDKLSVEEIMARVRNQLPVEEKIKLADYVITNDGSMDHLENQVKQIHQQLLTLAQNQG
ncbi:MAG TPA: dephospho-CoA kinase [Chitinophagales bacterium]|nr:dephospho-CoA kinase [Chitinophagales bacterium]